MREKNQTQWHRQALQQTELSKRDSQNIQPIAVTLGYFRGQI